MFGLGVPEILVIGALGVVFFGAGKLKGFGKDLGEGIQEFKKASTKKEPEEDVAEADKKD